MFRTSFDLPLNHDSPYDSPLPFQDVVLTYDNLSFLPYNDNSEREKQRAEQARQHAADSDTEWYRTTAFRTAGGKESTRVL